MLKKISNNLLLQKSYYYSPRSERSWLRDISAAYGNTCLLTGLSSDQITLERHHLYSKVEYPKLSLDPLNGVLISKQLHRLYHKIYTRPANPIDFLNFIHFLKNSRFPQLHKRLTLVELHIMFLNEELQKKHKIF